MTKNEVITRFIYFYKENTVEDEPYNLGYEEAINIDSPEKLKLQYGQKLVEVEYVKEGKLQKNSFSTVEPSPTPALLIAWKSLP